MSTVAARRVGGGVVIAVTIATVGACGDSPQDSTQPEVPPRTVAELGLMDLRQTGPEKVMLVGLRAIVEKATMDYEAVGQPYDSVEIDWAYYRWKTGLVRDRNQAFDGLGRPWLWVDETVLRDVLPYTAMPEDPDGVRRPPGIGHDDVMILRPGFVSVVSERAYDVVAWVRMFSGLHSIAYVAQVQKESDGTFRVVKTWLPYEAHR